MNSRTEIARVLADKTGRPIEDVTANDYPIPSLDELEEVDR